MRKSILAAAAVAGFLAFPTLASAEGEGAAAGAVTGGVTGAVVGGPVGAAVGAGVGAIAGGAAESSQPRAEQRVIVQPSEPVSERTCTADAAGNRTCTEIRR
jgi:uncharacterized protein YcfJ